ncbi:TonB-dependent receptor [Niveispirillum sp. KHB5.9]|uniref:TonB-dependent receptor n=1 Tax=Niveispirillum sp. KHB5.9 TaxID=3400269 RepID=UPI003A8AD77B
MDFMHEGPRPRMRAGLLAGIALSVLPLLPATGQTSTEPLMLEEIIVTAQKRLENLQTVPASVSVLSGERIARSSPTGVADYAAYMPGLAISSGGTPGQVSISLRGVSPVGPGATVGTYIDDTPLGSSANYARAAIYALDLFPYDIQQVEVLRGPQGTLYGASTMGGLLKYVTRKPDLKETEIRLGTDLSGTDGTGAANWGIRGQVNLPLVDDRLAVQASLYKQKNQGYINDARTGADGINPSTQKGARVALLWRPAEPVTVRLSALFQNTDSRNNAVVAYDTGTDQPIDGRLDSRYHMDQPFEKDLDLYTATLEWDLDFAALTSASSYSTAKVDTVQDASEIYGVAFPALTGGAVPAGLSRFDLLLDHEKFTQEVRLASPSGGGLEWMLGGFYTWEDSTNIQAASAQTMSGASIPGLDPLATASLPTTYEEVAVFGNATVAITDRFDITGGLRWAHNSQDFTQISDGALLGGAQEVPGTSSENVLTFMASPRLRVDEDLTLYGRVASSYRPGGPNVALPNVPPSVDADTLVSYEAGVKSTLLDGRLQANASIFYVDWKDIQISASTGGVSFLQNGGKAQSKGLEFETVFVPADGWRLGANGAYTDASFKGDIPGVGAQDGDRLPLIPKYSFALTADYEWDLAAEWTANVGGGYRWTGAVHSDPESSPEFVRTKAHGVLDLNAGVGNDTVALRFYIRNATNSHATTAADLITSALGAPVQIDRTVLQPRTIGLSLDLTY